MAACYLASLQAVLGRLQRSDRQYSASMGIYDKKVKSILGQSAWDILEKHVSHGGLDAEKMRDTALELNPKVGGGHLRRMQRRGEPDWFEFREVLSEWYQCEPENFDEDSQEALERLIIIFGSREVALPNLVKELQDCLLSLIHI